MLRQEQARWGLSGTETLGGGGKKRHCWHKNKTLAGFAGIPVWNLSSTTPVLSLCIFISLVPLMRLWFGMVDLGAQHGRRCGGRGSHMTVKISFDSWVSGQAPTSQQSLSHLKLFILIALNPPRCSELHMWSSLWEKPPRFAVYWPRQCVLNSNCAVKIACQRSLVAFAVRIFVFG